jgi:surfeit locus 1 family protein
MFSRLLSRRWWKTTILVVIGLGLLIRLGIWQLDRLAQRRAFNARVEAQIGQPVLTLRGPNLKVDLKNMEYRQVEVTGTYDFAGQVVLRNQAWNDQMGVDLLTPLHIAGSDQSVLVDRGWIPYEDFASGALGKYTQPGTVTVTGVIRASETRPEIGWRTDPVPAPG